MGLVDAGTRACWGWTVRLGQDWTNQSRAFLRTLVLAYIHFFFWLCPAISGTPDHTYNRHARYSRTSLAQNTRSSTKAFSRCRIAVDACDSACDDPSNVHMHAAVSQSHPLMHHRLFLTRLCSASKSGNANGGVNWMVR